MVQVPAVTGVTVLPETVQTPGVVGASGPTGTGCGEWEIAISREAAPRPAEIISVSDFLYPLTLDFRLSLGVTID